MRMMEKWQKTTIILYIWIVSYRKKWFLMAFFVHVCVFFLSFSLFCSSQCSSFNAETGAHSIIYDMVASTTESIFLQRIYKAINFHLILVYAWCTSFCFQFSYSSFDSLGIQRSFSIFLSFSLSPFLQSFQSISSIIMPLELFLDFLYLEREREERKNMNKQCKVQYDVRAKQKKNRNIMWTLAFISVIGSELIKLRTQFVKYESKWHLYIYVFFMHVSIIRIDFELVNERCKCSRVLRSNDNFSRISICNCLIKLTFLNAIIANRRRNNKQS